MVVWMRLVYPDGGQWSEYLLTTKEKVDWSEIRCKLEAAETKMSLITSLYFVAAWIPSMQVRLYLYFSTAVQKYTY